MRCCLEHHFCKEPLPHPSFPLKSARVASCLGRSRLPQNDLFGVDRGSRRLVVAAPGARSNAIGCMVDQCGLVVRANFERRNVPRTSRRRVGEARADDPCDATALDRSQDGARGTSLSSTAPSNACRASHGDVRLPPNSNRIAEMPACPKSAKSELTRAISRRHLSERLNCAQTQRKL